MGSESITRQYEQRYSPYTPTLNSVYGQSPFTNYDPSYDPLYQALIDRQRQQAQASGYPIADTAGQLTGMYAGDSLLSAGSGATAAPATPQIVGAARVPTSSSMWSMGDIGGAGNAILPAAGALGAYDVLSNNYGPGRSGLEGAASGAAIGSYFGPQGALIGGGIGGLIGLGKGFLGGKSKTKVEDSRYKKLQEQGLPGFTSNRDFTNKGADEQLQEALKAGIAKDFVGFTPSGQWVNTKFLASGKESDLTPDDIKGYAAFGEKFGKDWFGTFSEDQRKQIAQKALDLGAIREHHGTIDINSNKDLDAFVASLKSAKK